MPVLRIKPPDIRRSLRRLVYLVALRNAPLIRSSRLDKSFFLLHADTLLGTLLYISQHIFTFIDKHKLMMKATWPALLKQSHKLTCSYYHQQLYRIHQYYGSRSCQQQLLLMLYLKKHLYLLTF